MYVLGGLHLSVKECVYIIIQETNKNTVLSSIASDVLYTDNTFPGCVTVQHLYTTKKSQLQKQTYTQVRSGLIVSFCNAYNLTYT